MVMSFEDESSESRRRDDNGGNLPELKVDYWTEFLSEFSEGMMWHVGEEMKVTDYGKNWW